MASRFYIAGDGTSPHSRIIEVKDDSTYRYLPDNGKWGYDTGWITTTILTLTTPWLAKHGWRLMEPAELLDVSL